MKSIVNAVVVFGCAVAMAGNVCTYKGTTGGKLSDTTKWDVAPISGNGDTLLFHGMDSNATIENDIEGFSAAAMNFRGAGTITLSGKPITLTGATAMSNACSMVINTDLNFPLTGTQSIKFTAYKFTINSNINSDGTGKLCVYSFKEADGANTLSQNSVINGNINIPNGYYTDFMSSATIYHYGAITCKTINNEGATYSTGSLYYYGLITAERINVYYSNSYFCGDVANEPIVAYGWHNEDGRSVWTMNHDMTVGSVLSVCACTVDQGHFLTSGNGSTLTIHANNNVNFTGSLRGNANLVWDPQSADYVFSHTAQAPRTHRSTGTITVKGGTFKLNQGLYIGLSGVYVQGGTFEVSSPVEGSLQGLRTLFVSEGAKFVVTADAANPFVGDTVICLPALSAMSLPEGVVIEISQLYIDGQAQLTGDYTVGAGKLRVTNTLSDNTKALYSGAANDGLWTTAANWVGTTPDNASEVLVTQDVTSYAVTQNVDTVITKFTIGNNNGTNKAVFNGDLAMNENTLTINKGGELEMGAGTVLTMDKATTGKAQNMTIAKDGKLTLKDGSKLLLTGGRLDIADTVRGAGTIVAKGSSEVVFEHTNFGTPFKCSITLLDNAVLTNASPLQSRWFVYPEGGCVQTIVVSNNATLMLNKCDQFKLNHADQTGETVLLVDTTNTTMNWGNAISIGAAANCRATVDFRNGKARAVSAYFLTVGDTGIGTLKVSGGELFVSTWRGNMGDNAGSGIAVGSGATGVGRVELSGGKLSALTQGYIYVGYGAGAQGTVKQTGGTMHTEMYSLIGFNGSALAEYEISGGEFTTDKDLYVGDIALDDTVVSLNYHKNTGASGVLRVKGGTVNARNMIVGEGGVGKVEFVVSDTSRGNIAISQSLQACENSELVVDASAYTGAKSVTLLTANSITSDFESVSVVPEIGPFRVVTEGNKIMLKVNRGSIITVR